MNNKGNNRLHAPIQSGNQNSIQFKIKKEVRQLAQVYSMTVYSIIKDYR